MPTNHIEQIKDLIRVQPSQSSRECNIKTLNTIDTKTLNTKTLNTKHNYTFAQESEMSSGSASPVGQEIVREEDATLEQNDSSQVAAAGLEITFISASLKEIRTTRRTLNMDFRLKTTPSGEFNKLVFNLTDRHREFFANIPEPLRTNWEYEQAWEHYHTSHADMKWIGKGRHRARFVKGRFRNAEFKEGLAAVLEQRGRRLFVQVWIEGRHSEFELQPVENPRYPYRFDSGSALETVKIIPRGGWK